MSIISKVTEVCFSGSNGNCGVFYHEREPKYSNLQNMWFMVKFNGEVNIC